MGSFPGRGKTTKGDGSPEADIFQDLGTEEAALGRALRDELGQEHLFEGWEASKGDADKVKQKQQLLHQLKGIDEKISGGLKGYLERARALLKDAAKGENPLDGWVPEVPLGHRLEPGTDRFLEVGKAGLAELANCCFVLVAGGLGERLGYSGIKVELPTEITTNTCFLELYCRQILAYQVRYGKGKVMPLAIMVSDDTKVKTEKLLEANGNFGMAPDQITILKQEKVPALLDNNARIALVDKDPYQVQAKPHGHGDVHALLHSSGTAAKWLSEGRKWVFFFQDTNSLAMHAIPTLLGSSVVHGFHVNSSTIPRKAKQAVGAICKLSHAASGRCVTVNVEYNQIDPLLRANGYPDGDIDDEETDFSPFPGNINQLVCSLPEYAAVLAKTGGVMAEFVNPKYKDEHKMAFKKPTRLECMMQDYPKALEAKDPVGFTSVPMWLCFSPVKNSLAEARAAPVPASASSGEADKYRIFAHSLEKIGVDVKLAEPTDRAGVMVSLGPAIVFDPTFAIAQLEISEKFPEPQQVHISARSTLLIKGGGVTVKSLNLDGALTIDACEGATVTVEDLSVTNDGYEFVNLPDEGAGAPEILTMRGYDIQKKDMKSFTISSPGEYVLSDAGLSKI